MYGRLVLLVVIWQLIQQQKGLLCKTASGDKKFIFSALFDFLSGHSGKGHILSLQK
jgi:hypothetical protein